MNQVYAAALEQYEEQKQLEQFKHETLTALENRKSSAQDDNPYDSHFTTS